MKKQINIKNFQKVLLDKENELNAVIKLFIIFFLIVFFPNFLTDKKIIKKIFN